MTDSSLPAVATEVPVQQNTALQRALLFDTKLPVLTDEQKRKAEQTAGLIVPSDTAAVIQFGTALQGSVQETSAKWLDTVRKQDAGTVGLLLTELQGEMEKLDPSVLKDLSGWLWDMLDKVPVVGTFVTGSSEQVTEFLGRYDNVQHSLRTIEVKLTTGNSTAIAGIGILRGLRDNMNSYMSALTIAIAALKLKLGEMGTGYESLRTNLIDSNSADMNALTELDEMYNQMERIDRRVHSLLTAQFLTVNFVQQARMAENQLSFTAEAANEARTLGLTAWRQGIAIAVQLLKAQTQLEAIQAFRDITARMLTNNVQMLAKNQAIVDDMKGRAFVAAEVIAGANEQMATMITNAHQQDAKARDERARAVQLMEASQQKLIAALKQEASALLENPVETSQPEQAARPQLPRDIAADLLKS